MSADARVARAIQQVRAVHAMRPAGLSSHVETWLNAYESAVNTLTEEAKDAIRLTDHDIAQY